jgi:adenylate cyclase
VRYLLEGSVRRVGETITINAQLISAETGAHVWADRFDGERSKLGELQAEIVSRLAGSLGFELLKAEALRSMRERPANPDAIDLAMRTRVLYTTSSSTKSNFQDIINLCERALALDPQNEPAMDVLALTLIDRVTYLFSDDPAGDIARAEKLADSALALQPDSTWAHDAKAKVFYAKRQWRQAIAQEEAAFAADHNNAWAYAHASFWKMFVGRAEDGLAGVETALD